MPGFRTFHNSDPPRILKLWHNSKLGPSAAEGFPCDILELFVFSQPFFDGKGLILATEGEEIIGMAHASFAASDDGSQLDRSRGVISALAVHPDHRRQGLGRELLSKAEAYLAENGATTVAFGGGLDQNGFYNGMYGGLQASGFCHTAAPWTKFLGDVGYEPTESTFVMHRDLTMGRDPVSARLIRHRRRLNLVITDRVAEMPWWWHVRFGHLDALRFELQERHDESVVASAQVIGLDVFVPKWGLRAVGIREVVVPEEQRRHGYGLSIVLEICRRLREQSIQLIEAQVGSENSAANELFLAAGFEKAQELLCFRKSLS